MNSKKLIHLTEGKVSRQAFLQIQIKVKKYSFLSVQTPCWLVYTLARWVAYCVCSGIYQCILYHMCSFWVFWPVIKSPREGINILLGYIYNIQRGEILWWEEYYPVKRGKIIIFYVRLSLYRLGKL